VSALFALVASAVTLAAIAYLAATDPKRRRVFGVDPRPRRRHATVALAAALLPGPLLLSGGNGAGFVVWLGTAAVAGWGLTAMPPDRGRSALAWLQRLCGKLRGAVAGAAELTVNGMCTLRLLAALRDAPARIATLERRVSDLEAEVASLRLAQPGANRHLERSLAPVFPGATANRRTP
jgi:hypothetical protein